MEIVVLVGISTLIFISAAVQHFSTVLSRGVKFVMTDRSVPMPESGFSGRARRTLQNNMESALMMLPLVTVLLIMNVGTGLTNIVGVVYLVARIGFSTSYWLNLSLLRSICWAAGMASIMVTFTAILPHLF
ncbi:MAG: MAPEG family protein [Roseibium sp.]